MARRFRLLAFSAALHAGLYSGCLSHVLDRDPPVRSGDSLAKSPPPPSPYHAHAVEPVPRTEEMPPEVIQPVRSEAAPVEPPSIPEKPPEPPPLSVQPTVTVGALPEVKATPRDEPVVEALRLLLDRKEKNPAEAVAVLSRYDKPTQDVLLGLLSLAARLGEGGVERAAPEEVVAIQEQLRGLADALRGRAPLLLDKLCFCRRIDNFGGYEPLPPDYAFRAGGNGLPGERARVYVEVRNFTSRPRGDAYETRLESTLEIVDAEGKVVRKWDFAPRPDRSHSPRHDYFISFTFHVQPEMAPGWYTLWIKVKEESSATAGGPAAPRIARRSLDFRVTADGAIRAARERRAEASSTREGDK
jgi:hypothetical protein